jgi:Protein of unknown function (DUF3089)
LVRKFLYFVAVVIVMIIAAGFAMNIYKDKFTDFIISNWEPQIEFKEQKALTKSVYDDPSMWYARPEFRKNNPSLWLPVGAKKDDVPGPAAVFFVHPTSFISRDRWNASLDDRDTASRTQIFLKGLSSPFASVGQVWAPKYRQASIGAFLTKKPEGQAALDSAYKDVLLAFDSFIAAQQKDRPIILAGHSQGARHLTYLLRDRIAGKPLAKRIVAAYVIGWPISVDQDLSTLGLPACTSANQTGCIMSWESFAEPADYGRIVAAFDSFPGLNGQSRAGGQILCTNPLTGGGEIAADAEANLGTLKPSNDLQNGELVPKAVPARCDEKGFLLIGDPPNLGNYVIPGNNYHVYDIPLFWANIRFDALWRTRQYLTK